MEGRRFLSPLFVAVFFLVFIGSCVRKTPTLSGMLTYRNDNLRTGQNLGETLLTPQNVNSATFGKLASYPVDGAIYAQPLYVQNLYMGSLGVRNVVYVVTAHDSIYAFDANENAPGTLWHVNFLGSNATSIPCADELQACDFFGTEIGITSTPVIDPRTATLYLCAFTKENGTYIHRLHAIDLVTGAEKFGGPVVIQGTVPGKGVGGDSKNIHFSAYGHLLLPSLILPLITAGYLDMMP
jgi:hypothetical protein